VGETYPVKLEGRAPPYNPLLWGYRGLAPYEGGAEP